MPRLSVDPSRTGPIFRRFASVLRGKFNYLRSRIKEDVGKRDVLRRDPSSTLTRIAEALSDSIGTEWILAVTPVEKLTTFVGWLRPILNGISSQQDSYTSFLGEAYERGASRSYDMVRRKLVKDDRHVGGKEEFLRLLLSGRSNMYFGSSSSTLANAARNTPQVRDIRGRFISQKARTLAARLEVEMQGVTTWATQQMARTLVDGMDKGHTADQISRALLGVVDLSEARAMRVARTELVRAQAEGQLDAFSILDIDAITPMVEISTSGTACPLCEDLLGERYTVDEARGIIPVHPNCRCSWETV